MCRYFVEHIGHCSVHLINSGLTIDGITASIQFATVGTTIADLTCEVDRLNYVPCKTWP